MGSCRSAVNAECCQLLFNLNNTCIGCNSGPILRVANMNQHGVKHSKVSDYRTMEKCDGWFTNQIMSRPLSANMRECAGIRVVLVPIDFPEHVLMVIKQAAV